MQTERAKLELALEQDALQASRRARRLRREQVYAVARACQELMDRTVLHRVTISPVKLVLAAERNDLAFKRADRALGAARVPLWKHAPYAIWNLWFSSKERNEVASQLEREAQRRNRTAVIRQFLIDNAGKAAPSYTRIIRHLKKQLRGGCRREEAMDIVHELRPELAQVSGQLGLWIALPPIRATRASKTCR